MTTAEEINTNDRFIDNDEEEEEDLEKALLLAAANSDFRNQIPEKESLQNEESFVNVENTADSTETVIVKSATKRRIEESDVSPKRIRTERSVGPETDVPNSHTKVVAQHYNSLAKSSLDERYQSRIFYMRNFNNWIKSMLISDFLNKIKQNKKYGNPLKVFDMCCGKGGDLFKWCKGGITHLICSDLAAMSVEECEKRYKDIVRRERGSTFTAEFITADLSRVRVREKFKDASTALDLVSCQFSFHYSFESMQQAQCMLRNASECLRPGGYFIGTIPNANELIARQRKSDSESFGNDIYNVTFQCDTDKPPLFGAKYDFQLEGVVNCPEFLVYFPFLEKLAFRYGLKLVHKKCFVDYYNEMKDEGKPLLHKMQSFETYPPNEGTPLLGTAEDDYAHAEAYMKESNNSELKIGTLSKSEWEASSLYLTFAFQKMKTVWNKDGKPEYVPL